MPTAAVERDERSNGVDRESVRSLTDTSSNVAAVSQSSSKPRGQRRRARCETASPRSSDEIPDPEDPEAGCVRVPFSDLYLFKIGIGMRSSLIIVCINSVLPFISFLFSVGLALTGFLYGIFMIVCVVIKSQRIFDPCPFPSPNIRKGDGNYEFDKFIYHNSINWIIREKEVGVN